MSLVNYRIKKMLSPSHQPWVTEMFCKSVFVATYKENVIMTYLTFFVIMVYQ